jgi:autotransporter passenger strand-loop-strand repeat protein
MGVENTAIISVSRGGILDFDLTQTAPNGDALINDLSVVQGTPTYTLTVDGSQANGDYSLAAGATGFNSTISVVNTTGDALGTLTVGTPTTISGVDYVLELSGDVLSVSIGEGSGGMSGVTSSGLVITSETKTIYDREIYQDTQVSIGGILEVSSGGTALDTTVDSGGTMYISSGGSAKGAEVNSGGEIYVLSDGVLSSAAVNEGGKFYISGGTVSEATINYDAVIYLCGGVLDNVDVTSYSFLTVESGTANNVTIHSGGYLTLYEEGTLNNLTVHSDGSCDIYGGTIRNIEVDPGAYLNLHVTTDSYIAGKSAGSAFEIKDGHVSDFTIGSDCDLVINAGASASRTTINGGGSMIVLPGGTALEIIENGGYVSINEDASVTFANHTISGMVLSDSATIHSGTTMCDTTVTEGTVFVSSGGSGDRVTVNSYGRVFVSSGGSVTDITWTPCEGHVTVLDGGYATFTSRYSGVYYGYSGKLLSTTLTMNDQTISNGRRIYVMSGGTANNTIVKYGGYMYVSSGGTAEGIIETGGYVYIDKDAQVSFAATTIEGLRCNRSATLHSGTTANNTSVYGFGLFEIFSGGTANVTFVSQAQVNIEGEANSTTLRGGGSAYVLSGGTANDTILSGGGKIIVSSGGTANETTVSGGSLFVSSGGLAANTTVRSGRMTLSSGGTASNFFHSGGGGYIYVSSGGILTGQMTFAAHAYVSAYEGAVLDFNISELSPETAPVLVNNLSAIRGTVLYTLTVSPTQEKGAYTLAEKASNFNSTITIRDTTGQSLGTVCAGERTELNGVVYELSLVNRDALTLTVSEGTPVDTIPPTVLNINASTEEPTRGPVVLTAEFKDNVKVESALYRIGEAGTWLDYTANGVSVSENATVYFKAVDAAGNISEVAEYKVENIDRIAPDKPTASADITEPTNLNVTVTATFSEDSAQKQYSFADGVWNEYTDGILFRDNGTVFFRGIDTAGNISEIAEYKVENIDRVAPDKPTASADITGPTNLNVTVTATFSEDSVQKQYSFADGVWNEYTEGILFRDNGTVYFRGIDTAGNISEIAEYKVENIDRIAPDKPTARADITDPTNLNVTVTATFSEDSVQKQYSFADGVWNEYTEGILFRDNGTVFFRGIDAVGNISEIAEYKVENIDRIAPDKPTASADITDPTNLNVTVTAIFSEGSVLKQYKLDDNDWQDYTAGVVMTDNGTLYFRSSDASGNVSDLEIYTVGNIDKTPPVLSGLPTAAFEHGVLVFSWSAASDNVGVDGYRLTINETEYDVRGTEFRLEDGFAGNWSYSLQAYDAAGNLSAASESQTITILSDLQVESLRVLKNGSPVTSITTDDEVTIYASVKNTGEAKAAATTAAVYCGDTLLKEVSVAEIAANGTAEFTFEIEAGKLPTGIQEIRVVADSYDIAREKDEGNNTKTLLLNVKDRELSDLVVGSIRLDKQIYSQGESPVLRFTVKNIGDAEASATTVRIYDGNAFLGEVNVTVLAAGATSEELSYTIPGTLATGQHSIRVTVNESGDALESNPDNNSATINLTAGSIDLSVSKLKAAGNSWNTAEPIVLNFTVRNSGNESAAASTAGIYDGDTLLGTVDIPAVEGGLSISSQYEIGAGKLASGTHELRVVADLNNVIRESDETNNARSLSLTVSQYDDTAPAISDVSAMQGEADYAFTVAIRASDDVTAPDKLVYRMRYAESPQELQEAEILDRLAFSLTAEDAARTVYYQVSAADEVGNTAWSEVQTVIVHDVTPPEIGDVSVSTQDMVLNLSWSGTDNVGITSYDIYFDDELKSTQQTGSYTLSGIPAGNHTYRIDAFDEAGNSATTGNVKLTFNDSEAPAIIEAGLTQNASSYAFAARVTASDNVTPADEIVSRIQYAFSSDAVASAPVSGLAFQLTDEDAGKMLYYRVSAVDQAGNTAWSDILTLTVKDVTAPEIPTGLVNTVNGTSVKLDWTDAADNVGVTGYVVRYGTTPGLFGETMTVNAARYSLSNLAAGVFYWQTAAFDAAGNISDWSETGSFKILPADPYENNDTPAAAYDLGVLSGESTLTGGAVASASDEDWFRFTLDSKGTANDYIEISFDNKAGDLDLYLYNAAGTFAARVSDSNSSNKESISLKNIDKGTYLVKVSGKNGAMNTYTLTTKKVAGYDPDIYDANSLNDTIAAATVFDVEKNASNTISGLNLHEAGDTDYYQFTLSNMGIGEDSVSISFANASGDLDLYLYDASGQVLAKSAGTGNSETLSFNGMPAGVYYVQVKAPHNAVNEYSLNWKFTPNKVEADAYEGREPVAISESTEITDLTISPAAAGVTRADSFTITLNADGNSSSKIRLSGFRSDWNGMKYTLSKDDDVVLSGIGSEISLDGLSAGDYSLTVDTPVSGSYGSYNISVSLPEARESKKQAILLYACGDNNGHNRYLYDIVTMQRTPLQDNVEVYVLLDRSSWASDQKNCNFNYTNWTETRVAKVTYNPSVNPQLEWISWGEEDTGDISVLQKFLDWSMEEAQADNYTLVIKDHGNFTGGICFDQGQAYTTCLEINEIAYLVGLYDNISVVAFDACDMGSEDVLSAMAGVCDYVIASEAPSYSLGGNIQWDKFLESFSADYDSEMIAKAFIDSVNPTTDLILLTKKIDNYYNCIYGDAHTLAAYDVSQDYFSTALNTFAQSSGNFTKSDWIMLATIFKAAPSYGSPYSNLSYEYSDLGMIIQKALSVKGWSAEFLDAAEKLSGDIDQITKYHVAVPDDYGLSFTVMNPIISDPVAAWYYDYSWPAYYMPQWSAFIGKLNDYRNETSTISISDTFDQVIFINGNVNALDLGIFSGNGITIDNLNVIAEDYFTFDTTDAFVSGDKLVVTSANGSAGIQLYLYDGNMNLITSADNNVLDLSVIGDEYAADTFILKVASDTATSFSLSFIADRTTGCDRFDYMGSQINRKNVNGNGSIEKATSISIGRYSGLVTYSGDSDWFKLPSETDDDIPATVTVSGSGLTVAEYDAAGNLIRNAEYADGKYTLTMSSQNYLYVEGNADIGQDQVNGYSLSIEHVRSVVAKYPAVLSVSADVTELTNGNVTVSATFIEGIATRQYSYDETNWDAYVSGVVLKENGMVYFRGINENGEVSETASYQVSNIDKAAPEIPAGFTALVDGSSATLSWNASVDSGCAGMRGYEFRYGTSAVLSGNGNALVENSTTLSRLFGDQDYYYQVRAVDLAGNSSEWSEVRSFSIHIDAPSELNGDETGTSWSEVNGAVGYLVEYSRDDFATAFRFMIPSNELDTSSLPAGDYQWRVRAANGSKWTTGESITSESITAGPQALQSDEDGNADVFFANAAGAWDSRYAARHFGAINDWTGTGDLVSAGGKGRIQNLFFGSADPNVLCLTDADNGDALFVDDVYTDLPEGIAEAGQISRLYKIREIRAGAGDDIVDMTSQRFEYTGDGLTIRGGNGNDTIWANRGDNMLFGDAGNDRIVGASGNDVIVGGAGNDRMHGGGGNDVFTFCGNWGADTVEQLASGTVTLWFASGDESNWNADLLVYSDGTNSVSVRGVDSVTLLFGDDGSEQFATLTSAGAFLDATSERIFEESDKGVLASL